MSTITFIMSGNMEQRIRLSDWNGRTLGLGVLCTVTHLQTSVAEMGSRDWHPKIDLLEKNLHVWLEMLTKLYTSHHAVFYLNAFSTHTHPVHTHVVTHRHTPTCTHTHKPTYTHAHTCSNAHSRIHPQVPTHASAYRCTHTHMHTHVPTHAPCSLSLFHGRRGGLCNIPLT